MPSASTAYQGTDRPSRELMDACVHCGFCLPTCPTYLLWGEEMDSPRGRIYLMKAADEGRTAIDESFVRHIDACLGCLACVTACPSGVEYAPLIERTRVQVERQHPRDARDRMFRGMLLALVPYPARLRVVLAPLALFGGLARWAGRMLKRGGRPRPFMARTVALLSLTPRVSFRSLLTRVPAETPSSTPERLRVGLLAGCVQRLVFDHVNRATIRVLAAEGCRVVVPGQGCCGALSLHSGHIEQARALARRNIEAFEHAGVDRVVVNAAGCGSAMKEYGHLFADDAEWGGRAAALSARVRDVSELLVELGPARAERHPIAAKVVYHDACHLAHGQGVRAQPRSLLAAIPGVELSTPAEAEICCGSAGIYNLVQPIPAAQLGARKAAHIAALAPDMVVTANPGCLMQIAAAAADAGHHWPIFHPVELVDASIRGVDPRTGR